MRPARRQVGVERLGLARDPAARLLGLDRRADLALSFLRPAGGGLLGPGGGFGPRPTGCVSLEPRGLFAGRLGEAGRLGGAAGRCGGGGRRGFVVADQALAEPARLGAVTAASLGSVRAVARAILAAGRGWSAGVAVLGPGAAGVGPVAAAFAVTVAGRVSFEVALVILRLDVGDVEEAVAADREV
ncbi:MAG: hypothetical protein LC745_11300, partial [Planctomycetia bacterium]|nr:hypothetical protein [Planctomycetia bacterium]